MNNFEKKEINLNQLIDKLSNIKLSYSHSDEKSLTLALLIVLSVLRPGERLLMSKEDLPTQRKSMLWRLQFHVCL